MRYQYSAVKYDHAHSHISRHAAPITAPEGPLAIHQWPVICGRSFLNSSQGPSFLFHFDKPCFLDKCSRKHHTFSTISLNQPRARQMGTVSRQRSGLNKTRKYCELKLHISLLTNWKYYSTESRWHLRCNRNNNVIYFATHIILALVTSISWWRHQMEIISALLSFCEGNPQETGGFPSQRPVTRSFDVFFDLWVKRVSKQSRRSWFETPSRSLWRHCYVKMLCLCLW